MTDNITLAKRLATRGWNLNSISEYAKIDQLLSEVDQTVAITGARALCRNPEQYASARFAYPHIIEALS